ncbi:lysylphosphatidylglycerol synthase transmembrane domain-containing protein [Ktedonosporobacter rubrisoli]|uniref:lysylphosphatidylglycerol synthase transmembrane domain-containing protein n=1 Tax=Ktedonosporobacter rubrisoli TaxID=2509675 RepID=UPI0013EEBC03|nr:lysylphosphatidylglycerol synthase transmembrane domain-containing protein [Ktedonosporobacter rubrisoli]
MRQGNPDPASSSLTTENPTESIEIKKAELLHVLAEQEKKQEEGISRDQLALKKRLLSWRTLVPLVVVIVALIIFLQLARIDPQKTWSAISNANPWLFLCAFGIYYLSIGLRALRWRLLLQNVGFTKANGVSLPGFWKTAEIIYISFFANALVPAKLGDLYRAYLLRQEIGVSTTRSFGTVLAERLLDLTVLLLLFIPALIISLHENLPEQLKISLEILLAVVIAGIAGLYILKRAREPIARLIPLRFREHYYHFHEGTLGSFRRVPTLSAFTVGVWLCEALRFFFVALSLKLIGGDLVHILAATIFIGLGEALLTIIPATGGGIGLVEGGMLAMIALFYHGPNAINLTAAAILLDRAISLFSVQILGFLVFLLAFGRKTVKRSFNDQKS